MLTARLSRLAVHTPTQSLSTELSSPRRKLPNMESLPTRRDDFDLHRVGGSFGQTAGRVMRKPRRVSYAAGYSD